MTYSMAIWIALVAVVMALSRAFPLRTNKCGMSNADVDFTVGYAHNALMPALALDMAGIILIWVEHMFASIAAPRIVLSIVLILILAASGYIYLLVNRFILAVGKNRIVVQPAFGKWYSFEFDKIERITLGHAARGVSSVELFIRGGRHLRLNHHMYGFDMLLARLSSEAMRSDI